MSLRIKELNRALDEARSVQFNTEQVRDAFLDQVAVVDRHWAQVCRKGNYQKKYENLPRCSV